MINCFCLAVSLLLSQAVVSQFQHDDVMLDYAVEGSGPPVYLLHGGWESRDSFVDQIPYLAREFTVVALDSREQGRSSASDSQISYELMMGDVVALAAHLGHDKISLVGQSDGGVTALTVAIRHPELVDKLILMGTNYHYEAYSEETRALLENYEWDGNEDPGGIPGMFIEHYLKGQKDLTGFGAKLKEMGAMWATSPTFTTEDLSGLQAKTLIINGDHYDIDYLHINQMHQAIPDADLFIVPGATHFLHREKPKLVNGVILDFLTE